MKKSPSDKSKRQSTKSTLDPLSYTKAEAEKMLGHELIGLVETGSLKMVSGDRGVVVTTRRNVNFRGDKHEYLVGIQWTDREGSLSEVDFHSKEQVRLYTRGLNLAERIKSFQQRTAINRREESLNVTNKRLGRKL